MTIFEGYTWEWDSVIIERIARAERIYNRYMKQEGGIPYALRFKALMKTWGIYL